LWPPSTLARLSARLLLVLMVLLLLLREPVIVGEHLLVRLIAVGGVRVSGAHAIFEPAVGHVLGRVVGAPLALGGGLIGFLLAMVGVTLLALRRLPALVLALVLALIVRLVGHGDGSFADQLSSLSGLASR
jgi:hypothetical protein